jgi:hypothetical protein
MVDVRHCGWLRRSVWIVLVLAAPVGAGELPPIVFVSRAAASRTPEAEPTRKTVETATERCWYWNAVRCGCWSTRPRWRCTTCRRTS